MTYLTFQGGRCVKASIAALGDRCPAPYLKLASWMEAPYLSEGVICAHCYIALHCPTVPHTVLHLNEVPQTVLQTVHYKVPNKLSYSAGLHWPYLSICTHCYIAIHCQTVPHTMLHLDVTPQRVLQTAHYE